MHTYTFNTYILYIARSIEKNTKTCFHRYYMHILFYEQAIYERDTKMIKVLMKWETLSIIRKEAKSLPFKEQRKKRPRWILWFSWDFKVSQGDTVLPCGKRVDVCITTSLMVVRSCCNLIMGKGDKHTKLCLCSLTQKFICYFTFKVVIGRKKQSMKTESPTLVGQRKTCHEEKEQTQILNFLNGVLLWFGNPSPGLFLVSFIYYSHSLVTGWPTMSALTWLTQVNRQFCRLSAFSSYYFFSLSPSPEISLPFSF